MFKFLIEYYSCTGMAVIRFMNSISHSKGNYTKL